MGHVGTLAFHLMTGTAVRGRDPTARELTAFHPECGGAHVVARAMALEEQPGGEVADLIARPGTYE